MSAFALSDGAVYQAFRFAPVGRPRSHRFPSDAVAVLP